MSIKGISLKKIRKNANYSKIVIIFAAIKQSDDEH